ncbi:MAG: hypothetical protein KDA45_08065, partial [Planctomycetales bacterium]|nr:hypothetical protein [Planctomycetales bacterium]
NSSDQQVELGLLDAALKADPTNSVAVEQLAIAAYKGQQLAPESMELLEKSLVDGNASGVTHLIMANRKLIADELEAAIGHLRLALNQMPGNPIVLNNLAFALFKLHPEKVDEAAELIDQALKAPSTSPQQTANMLDTQGQVRLGQNDKLGAIGSFEQAIKLDTNKLDTRRRLAEVYRQMGMADLADAQLKRIEELEK